MDQYQDLLQFGERRVTDVDKFLIFDREAAPGKYSFSSF
jgi:hypothetical protein